MERFHLALDSRSHHALVLMPHESPPHLRLCHSLNDRFSRLHVALRRHLRFLIDQQLYEFANDTDTLLLPPSYQHIAIHLGSTHTPPLARLRYNGSHLELVSHTLLSPFETRFLAHNGFPHVAERAMLTALPALHTDLHTHYAGCVQAQDVLRIGIEHGVSYAATLLAQAGVKVSASQVPLAALNAELLAVLAERLTVPADRRMPFADMETIYRLRAPITKSLRTFPAFCRQLAEDYRAMGVTYVELSLSNIVEAAWLRQAHATLPAIERDTGLTIRFLAALSRHDDAEWDLDYIERLQQVAGSRYIVGIDVMGHETNSTWTFVQQLRTVAAWAHQARPGFIIRVHAGENPAYPENIRVALDAVAGYDVQLRIGHGLFGVDAATLVRLRQSETIVEFNLNSNLALNNIQSMYEVPLKMYLEHGVNVVLGTDGYGIYQTSLAMEARAACLAGLTADDFARIQAVEMAYVQQRRQGDGLLSGSGEDWVVPDDPPPRHYTPQVLQRRFLATEQRRQRLRQRLAELAVPLLDAEAAAAFLRGKQCLSFAGAWRKSWPLISPAAQQHIHQQLAQLFAQLDPRHIVILSGGTGYGVEHLVQSYARQRGFLRVGVLVWETPPQALYAGAITHAVIAGERLYDKAAGLYQWLKQQHGLAIFIGGGNIVNDEIQTADNLRLRYLLMDGPAGASSVHARQQPGRAFRTAADIIAALARPGPWTSTQEPYWHPGVNPTVDMVLTRHHPVTQQLEILLIRRDDDARTEPGKWALPGGFQLTTAPRGTAWQADVESAREACGRELLEETGLDLRPWREAFVYIGEYQGGGRDPRDTPHAWSRSSVFAFHLPAALATTPIAGSDDASDACWIPLEPLPDALAFDHARLIRDAVKRLYTGNSAVPPPAMYS